MNDYRPIFKTCAICGKSFIVHSEEYIYKRRKGHNQKTIYFCGWNHMRQWDTEEDDRKHRAKNKHADFG